MNLKEFIELKLKEVLNKDNLSLAEAVGFFTALSFELLRNREIADAKEMKNEK